MASSQQLDCQKEKEQCRDEVLQQNHPKDAVAFFTPASGNDGPADEGGGGKNAEGQSNKGESRYDAVHQKTGEQRSEARKEQQDLFCAGFGKLLGELFAELAKQDDSACTEEQDTKEA